MPEYRADVHARLTALEAEVGRLLRLADRAPERPADLSDIQSWHWAQLDETLEPCSSALATVYIDDLPRQQIRVYSPKVQTLEIPDPYWVVVFYHFWEGKWYVLSAACGPDVCLGSSGA